MGLSSKQVSGDGLDWSQQIGDNGVEIPKPIVQARNQQQRIQCPRCDSSNTKFCYYNNYSRLQPRHFCRACRRHWTAGGTLRNVPVGGGRKNKRPKITTTTNCDYGQQVPEPFSSVGELEGSIFPDVYYQLLLYPPPISSDQGDSNSSMTSLLSPPPPPLLPEFAAARSAAMASTDEAVVINPSPMSVPEEILLSTTTTACPWLQDPPPLPASYCWNWWDDTTDLVGSATADGA